jgi:hypothetical protein
MSSVATDAGQLRCAVVMPSERGQSIDGLDAVKSGEDIAGNERG